MILVEDISVFGLEHAIRGMRNPLNSWGKSDSVKCDADFTGYCNMLCGLDCNEPARCYDGKLGYCVGKKDLDLMQRLYKGGSEHRKYLRMIHVQMEVTAPLYWWKEFDTYKIGTTANSCSTMHKIHSRDLTLADFSHERTLDQGVEVLKQTIDKINDYRRAYNRTNNKMFWDSMIQILPSSYNQKRTLDFNYETVMNIIHQRKNHKLKEWIDFVKELEKLPYVTEILNS